jgi:hypothetical protein
MAVASTRDRLSVVVNRKPNVIVNQSNLAVKRLGDLTDIDLSDKKDGSVLIYNENEQKFVTSTLLDKQQVNGGFF